MYLEQAVNPSRVIQRVSMPSKAVHQQPKPPLPPYTPPEPLSTGLFLFQGSLPTTLLTHIIDCGGVLRNFFGTPNELVALILSFKNGEEKSQRIKSVIICSVGRAFKMKFKTSKRGR